MRSASLRTRLTVSVLLLGVAATGCAKRAPDTTPGDIPAIREQLRANPGDQALQTRLGAALYRSGDFAGAEEALARVVEEGEPTGTTYLYLGLANERQEDWSEARQAYQSYLAMGTADEARDEIRSRLALIARNELRQQAREALSQEAELTTTRPAPRSVAVFPFRMLSDDEDLDPLRLALADMMITDLGLVGGITVLERSQIQALLDEMALTEAGLTESSTGARAGRLLGSEHVVQGVLTTTGENQLLFNADVLNTESRSSRGQITDEAELAAIFDAEKRVVFGVLDALQVQLTAAEREAITENRAENLLAFLEYGRGLGAMDRGDFEQAAQHFQSAVQMDPSFAPAQAQQQEAEELQVAAATPPEEVEAAATGETPAEATAEQAEAPAAGTEGEEAPSDNGTTETLGGIDNATMPTAATSVIGTGTPGGAGGEPPPSGGTGKDDSRRDTPVQEGTGQDKTGGKTTTVITIKIQRPPSGGGEEL